MAEGQFDYPGTGTWPRWPDTNPTLRK